MAAAFLQTLVEGYGISRNKVMLQPTQRPVDTSRHPATLVFPLDLESEKTASVRVKALWSASTGETGGLAFTIPWWWERQSFR